MREEGAEAATSETGSEQVTMTGTSESERCFGTHFILGLGGAACLEDFLGAAGCACSADGV